MPTKGLDTRPRTERLENRPASAWHDFVNHNHDLKNLFKSAATQASVSSDPWGGFYENLLASGMKPAMARLTLARKMAAIVLKIWKKGEHFNPELLKRKSA